MKKKFLQMLMFCVFALFSMSALAQQTVTGVVSDNSGELLPGASVSIKGTSQGTITDIDGNFTISVPDASATLVFSFVGMVRQEIVVGNQSTINVILATSSIGLDDVVVTALGISREKKSLGYSVGEVEGEALQKVANSNVLNSLAGKVSGVSISSTGGTGSSVSMVIRGASSLTSDNQPLFVIDGVPMNNSLNNMTEMASGSKADYGNAISDLNAEDIENVSILKGPSAAALYGSRAGNGVVLITTKTGRKSKGVGVTITSNTVIESPYKFLDKHTLFANGKRPYTQDNRPDNGLDYYSVPAADSYWVGPALDKGMLAYQWPFFDANGDLTARELVSHPDNYKDFFQTGYTTTNGVSIVDANEKMNYRLSYNNMQNKGIIPNSDLNKNSISLNSSLKVIDNLTVSSSLNFTVSGADNRPSTQERGANPLQYLYDLNSHIDIDDLRDYWVPGMEGLQQRGPYNLKVNSDGTYEAEDMMNNPFFLANEVNNGFQRDRFYGNAKVDWKINSDFNIFARYTHDQFHEKRETKIAPSYDDEPNGFYGVMDMYRVEQNADFLLTYKKVAGEFNVSASVGGNYMYQYASNLSTQAKQGGSGLIVPNVYTIGNIAPDNLSYSSSSSQKGIYSAYALASFGYKDAIYLDLTARNDWSSTLPAENRSYFYPSASLSMLVNNMVDLGDKVSMVKLRGGWAMVGNDTGAYQLLASMGNLGSWGNEMRLGTSGTLLLPDLKPEIQTSWEIGADLAFYDSRLRIDGTYYAAENENQILSIGLPSSSGYSGKQINAGLISSKGVEFGVGGTIITNSDWNWDVNLIFSRNRTKIVELSEGFDYFMFWDEAKGGAYTWVGEEVGQIIDRALVRVDDPNSPYNGWPIIDDEGWEDSDKTRQDADGNRVAPVTGNYNPNFTIGMQTAVSYKSWTLSASFDWRSGGQFVSQTYRYGESDLHTNRWMEKALDLNHLSPAERAQYLTDHSDEYLSPDGEFFVIVGGPTAEYGGIEHTEGGITLNDGVFMPGVVGDYDENGNFVAEYENLGGSETPMIRYQDYYGWSYGRNATFDADYIKLRDISLTYQLPKATLNSIGIQNIAVSLYSRNIILWTKAGIGIDPETAFQAGASRGGGSTFAQGIERYNVNPWTVPVGIKVNLSF